MAVEVLGSIALWRGIEDLQALAFVVQVCLVSAGLGAYPVALVCATHIYHTFSFVWL